MTSVDDRGAVHDDDWYDDPEEDWDEDRPPARPMLTESANVWWYVTDARPSVRHYFHGNSRDDICTELTARVAITKELSYMHESTEGLRVWPFRREQDNVQEIVHATH